MHFVAKDPNKFTDKLVLNLSQLIESADQVDPNGLEWRIRHARFVGYCELESEIISVGAIKQPITERIKSIFKKAKTLKNPDDYKFELGWLHTRKGFERKGLAKNIARELISMTQPEPLFATVVEGNKASFGLMKSLGFESSGRLYQSNRGNYRLALLLREYN